MKKVGRTITSQLFVINDFPCPECGSKTITWKRPSRWAGIWECLNEDCGTTDVCEHPTYHEEEVTVYRPTQEQIDRGTDRDEVFWVYVCDTCGETIEDKDPVLDRLEAAYD